MNIQGFMTGEGKHCTESEGAGMKEYIERTAVEKFIEDGLNNPDKNRAFGHDAIEIMAEVHYMPAADVVEVRHGRWIGLEYDGYADGCPVYDLWECSECCEEVRGEDVPSTHPWCHSCGARMDKEDEHEQ